MAIGKAYVRNDGDVGTNTQMSLAELRLHLPSGFPLDRYELLPQHIPSDPSDLLIREVATDEDGLRAVIFADGHGTFVHK